MLQKLYLRSPRPTLRVVFFGNGRFRRFRDGVLARDPEQRNDPHITLDITIDRDHDGPFIGEPVNHYRIIPRVTASLYESGVCLAESHGGLTRTCGRRRPDLEVLIFPPTPPRP